MSVEWKNDGVFAEWVSLELASELEFCYLFKMCLHVRSLHTTSPLQAEKLWALKPHLLQSETKME